MTDCTTWLLGTLIRLTSNFKHIKFTTSVTVWSDCEILQKRTSSYHKHCISKATKTVVDPSHPSHNLLQKILKCPHQVLPPSRSSQFNHSISVSCWFSLLYRSHWFTVHLHQYYLSYWYTTIHWYMLLVVLIRLYSPHTLALLLFTLLQLCCVLTFLPSSNLFHLWQDPISDMVSLKYLIHHFWLESAG